MSGGAITLTNVGEMPIVVIERNGGTPYVATSGGTWTANSHTDGLPGTNVDDIERGDGALDGLSLFIREEKVYGFHGGTEWYSPVEMAGPNDWSSLQRGTGLTNVVKIVSSQGNYLARTGDGKLWYFGEDWLAQGRVGSDPLSRGWMPVLKSAGVQGSDRVDMAVAGRTALYVDTSGYRWRYGLNWVTDYATSGASGSYTTYPTKIKRDASNDFVNAKAVSGGTDGYYDDYSFSIIKTDNTLWCWGNNQHGQLASGAVQQDREYSLYPTQARLTNAPTYITNVAYAEINGYNLLVATIGGAVYAASINGRGELGDSGNTSAHGAGLTQVKASGGAGLSGIGEIAPRVKQGIGSTCFALKTGDGDMYRWGSNDASPGLGDGSSHDTSAHRVPALAMHGVTGDIGRLTAAGHVSTPRSITAYGGASIPREMGGAGTRIAL